MKRPRPPRQRRLVRPGRPAHGRGPREKLASGYVSRRSRRQRQRNPDRHHGDAGLVLTAGHLFEDKIGPITVEFHDGQVSGARILAIDKKLDVAALWIFAPKGIAPMPLGRSRPAAGPAGGNLGLWPQAVPLIPARVARPIPMDGDMPHTLVAAQGVVDKQVTIPGDSGGPMVADGHIVAVHWGYRGGEEDPRRCVHALGCSTLNEWLRSELDPTLWRTCLSPSDQQTELRPISPSPTRLPCSRSRSMHGAIACESRLVSGNPRHATASLQACLARHPRRLRWSAFASSACRSLLSASSATIGQ